MPRSKNYNEDFVLNSAMNVFWSNGYRATSIRLLEKEMGINQFSIYSSFNNKKELFLKSIRKYRKYVKENVYKDLLKPDASLVELKNFLLGSGDAKNKSQYVKGCLVVNTAAEMGNKDLEIAKEIDLYYNFIRDMMKEIILTSINKKEISSNINVDQYANYLLGVMQGVSIASKNLTKRQLNDFVTVALEQLK